jgi:hypothetical protein
MTAPTFRSCRSFRRSSTRSGDERIIEQEIQEIREVLGITKEESEIMVPSLFGETSRSETAPHQEKLEQL